MDSTDATDETWEAWSARVARELEHLGPDDWMTLVVHVDSAAAVAEERRAARRGWRRAFAPPPPPPPVPDVFLQARPIEGLLALECIGDAEFEGITDLTARQLETLAALGWEPDGDDPHLSATFDVSESADAADLIATSLRGVLGAESPAHVDLRRSS